ncbi:oxidoreductase [Sinomonas cyclohexanicum]|uniref:Oxidoreductase n=1 Tax=Sinomonas cyclohexanicum TaxID=322009 RepID=A0ABM7PUV8_SINCY|nr:SDR family NAD(P)-dependent oxidoreductase [Corynebacterium cyclohexanicum]BCT76043.1 oxidoreductase [Corynebacterium cyclohexanicum]
MTHVGAQDSVVVVAGATSASGRATVAALRAAGATAVAVGSNADHLTEAFGASADAHDGGVPQFACDLADLAATQSLAADVRARFGRVDGVIHLVGGWRGGGTFAQQGDADWDFLVRGCVTTLRNTSRAFFDDIAASPTGRFAMVSTTTLARPSAANANYQAAKAAAEAWTRSMAQGLALLQSKRPEKDGGPLPQASAAVVLAVKALLDDAMREASPERTFPGYTPVDVLAERAVTLFSRDAAEINGARIDLTS